MIIIQYGERADKRANKGAFKAQPTFPGERAVQAVPTQTQKNLLLNDT